MSLPDAASPGPSLGAFTLSIPIAMGYVPLGMVYGFLFVKAGAAWWLATLASVLVFAGAAQYMAIPLLAAGVPISTLAFATLVINLRHLFYGLSLLDHMPRGRAARAYLAWALTDETYSVLTSLPARTADRKLVGIALLNHGWWVLGATLGALIGARAQISLKGLDFTVAALFAMLAIEQWRSTRQPLPILCAVASYALAQWWLPAQALAVAIGLCLLAAIVQAELATRRSAA
ncbi:AzlC family ABC transporter permease [Paludibacterium sp. B53371]|uniref:AzlC family ABC transporter permease n=1 Tax=Paludibacterium sp. B53371 TaxID=2806263 RepID=UPI001C056867|nr:AzlC family ABC transporter permease [Paludibacterium sp. B53371]